jgi:hypothetical protein
MRFRIPRFLTAVLSASLGLAPNAAAQHVNPCRSADSTSARLIGLVTKYTTTAEGDGVEARDSLGLPAIPADQVVLITKKTTCNAAVQAYAAHVTVNSGTLSGSVYVVQAGSTYVVYDPQYVYSIPEAPTIMIFDSQFNLLSMTTG